MKKSKQNESHTNKSIIRYIISGLILLFVFAFYVLSSSSDSDTKYYNDSKTPGISNVSEESEVSGSAVAENSNEINYTFRSDELLQQHFDKHGKEFDYFSAEEYVAGANKVIASKDALRKTEAEDGDFIYYLEATNEIVFVSSDGYIRTYFKPRDGIEYYKRQ